MWHICTWIWVCFLSLRQKMYLQIVKNRSLRLLLLLSILLINAHLILSFTYFKKILHALFWETCWQQWWESFPLIRVSSVSWRKDFIFSRLYSVGKKQLPSKLQSIKNKCKSCVRKSRMVYLFICLIVCI